MKVLKGNPKEHHFGLEENTPGTAPQPRVLPGERWTAPARSASVWAPWPRSGAETISLVELSTRKPKDAEPGKWVVSFGFLSKPNYCYVGPGAGSVASSVHLCSLLVREYILIQKPSREQWNPEVRELHVR